MHQETKNKLLIVTHILTILYALHYGIPLYATSSYLHTHFNSLYVSALYMLGSISALCVSIYFARYIKRFHTYRLTAGVAISEIIIIISFAITDMPFLLGLFFILHFVAQTLLYICLNIFVESFSKYAETGSIRGLFLALLNIGILISPFIGGTILAKSSFEALYIIAALMLLPFLFFLKKYLSHIEEPAYHMIDMVQALDKAKKDKNLRAALIASLCMECFYAVMIIYSPIYLVTIGIPLTVYLTYILPIALAPLVLLPYELGILADKKYGEKELMIVGFLILIITTLMFVVVASKDALVWVAILLISRIGASCLETMTFTYYFKKVGVEDVSLTALFNNTRSAATVLISLFGILISPFISNKPQLMFVVLVCILLVGLYNVFPMKDTK